MNSKVDSLLEQETLLVPPTMAFTAGGSKNMGAPSLDGPTRQPKQTVIVGDSSEEEDNLVMNQNKSPDFGGTKF